MSWANVPQCSGNFKIFLMNDAPTNFVPVHEEGIRLVDNVIHVKGGSFSQMMGALVFWSPKKKEFYFGYRFVARIVTERGRIVWKNRDCQKPAGTSNA